VKNGNHELPPMVNDPNDPENLDYPTRKDVEKIKKMSFNSDRHLSKFLTSKAWSGKLLPAGFPEPLPLWS
jgi:hypothetical protein